MKTKNKVITIVILALVIFLVAFISEPKFRFGSVVLTDTLTGSLKIGVAGSEDFYTDETFTNGLKIFDNNVPEDVNTLHIYYALQEVVFKDLLGADSLKTKFTFMFSPSRSIYLDTNGITIQNYPTSNTMTITKNFSQNGDSTGVLTPDGILQLEVNGVTRYLQLYK